MLGFHRNQELYTDKSSYRDDSLCHIVKGHNITWRVTLSPESMHLQFASLHARVILSSFQDSCYFDFFFDIDRNL